MLYTITQAHKHKHNLSNLCTNTANAYICLCAQCSYVASVRALELVLALTLAFTDTRIHTRTDERHSSRGGKSWSSFHFKMLKDFKKKRDMYIISNKRQGDFTES